VRYQISSAYEFAYASIKVNNISLNLGDDDLEDLYIFMSPNVRGEEHERNPHNVAPVFF
jgi:hypothetical protein